MSEPLLASPDLEKVPVYDALSVPIGVTFGVLTEADSGLVRFFDIALEGRQRHVLVPVGHARLEKHLGGLRLRLRAATAGELDRIPSYEPHTAWRDDVFQNELLTAFGRLFEGERYYAHPAYDHSGLYAGAHPLLRDPLSPVTATGLRRLSTATAFRIAEGETDVRGWDVMGELQSRIGTVSDLVIDTEAEQVRYYVVRREVDDRETAVPIGYLELREGALHAPLSVTDVVALPEFDSDVLQRSEEASLRAVLDSLLAGSRRYLRPDFTSAA
jgi:hypothetical protein